MPQPPSDPLLTAPDDGDAQARSTTSAKRGHGPWRTVGLGIASLGTPVGIGVLHPILGEVIAVLEVAATLTITGTALFGSSALSERAFRLLRWLGNRPEPPSPAPGPAVHLPQAE